MATRKDFVTFVMPYYAEDSQASEYLDTAVEGILRQTSDRWNVVIIDDASPWDPARHKLRRVVDRAPAKIHILHRDSNGGAGVSRNEGIDWAVEHGGEIIAFNDADDVSHCARVERLLALFGSRPEVSVVYSTFAVIDEHGTTLPEERGSSVLSNTIIAAGFAQ